MQKIKRLLASALTGITSVALLVSPVAAASTTVVVTPSDMQGWAFFQEIPTGTGSLVEGPGTPPLGTGSAELEVDSTGRELLLNNDYAGTRLADITSLSYSTYRQTGVDGDAATLSLQFDIDNDDSDTETAWQGRLVYEPYFTNTVNTEEWQTWNTLDNAEAGNWWGSPNAVSNLDEVCPQSDPCTWDEVLAAFPDAAIRENDLTDTAGFMHIKAGGPVVGGLTANVDAVTIGVNDTETVFDFEATEPEPEMPTSKDDCKNGGWEDFGVFKNQGDCVSWVASQGRNAPAMANNPTF